MKKGHTLLEVMLAAALFGTLLLALTWVYATMLRSQRQADPASEAARLALLALEKTRAELGDALVESVPHQALEIAYRVPRRDAAGQVLVGDGLGIDWGPVRTLRAVGGVLERVEAGTGQRVALLGAAGYVRFDRPDGEMDLVVIEVQAEARGRTHRVTSAVSLRQQR